MAFSKHSCVTCSTVEEIPDFVEKVFPDSAVICHKCNKSMKGEYVVTKIEVKTDYKEQVEHPVDPRTDLQADAYLWTELLTRLYVMNKELYFTFYGLRCSGSKLELKDEKIEFTFSDELDSAEVERIRAKYIKPSVKIIQGVMARLAKDMSSTKSLKDCPF